MFNECKCFVQERSKNLHMTGKKRVRTAGGGGGGGEVRCSEAVFSFFERGGRPEKLNAVSLNASLVAVSFYRHTTEFLTISLQHKNANIANFVLVVPFKINTTIEVCNLEVQSS